MSKKRKTLFQIYLDRQGLGDTKKTEMSNEVGLSNTISFFEKNLDDFHEVESVNGMRMFSGNSEDGNCMVTERGGLFCKETGFVGNPVKLLLSEDKNLTEAGAKISYLITIIESFDEIEGVNHHALDQEHLFGRINSSRGCFSSVEKLKTFGLEKEIVANHPFWFDGHSRFFYLYLNRLNFPVCKHAWRFDGDIYHENIIGVSRLIESPEADRVFFVENPMQLISMSDMYPEPIYVRPTAHNYLDNDFSRLIQGKQVICIKAKNQRSADPTNFDLTYLKSNDPLELLTFYEQGTPQESLFSEGELGEYISSTMDDALASIELYLKIKGISL